MKSKEVFSLEDDAFSILWAAHGCHEKSSGAETWSSSAVILVTYEY